MENASLSVEESLRSDKTGEYAREVQNKLKQIEIRLAAEARKLYERSTHEKIKAAETAVISSTALMQLFESAVNFEERK